MIKKIIMISLLIIIGVSATIFGFKYNTAKHEIASYMEKQGIKKEDIQKENPLQSWIITREPKRGYFWSYVYIKDEDPSLQYRYWYYDGKVKFAAVKVLKASKGNIISEGIELDSEEKKKLKYPPLD
ncbi:DUF3139 domain-containing protein [Bacillus sp. CDB3]|uniref:DUF3139 domain-containing protein n=1 Tax=Bacillus sp. CDB3 TaxID=360310 RepID=UPI0015C4D102|nr:DUF3139 domain-containing protein [Bacillus sp. CDB3]